MKYTARVFEIPSTLTDELRMLAPERTYWAIFWIWASIAALAGTASWLRQIGWFWPFYLPLGFLVAGRQGALLQIIHEGSHKLVAHKKSVNDFIANGFAALPVGITLARYTSGHMQHHAYTGTEYDLSVDLEKHADVDFRKPRIYVRFLRDITGITAFHSTFFRVAKKNKSGPNSEAVAPPSELDQVWKKALVQAILFFTVFRMDPFLYFFMWAIPVVTFNMVLMRVRGIAEHGQPTQLGVPIESVDQGNYYTRSIIPTANSFGAKVLHGVEKVLIGSLSANYHHEHHLVPNIPYYNLARLSAHLHPQIAAKNPSAFSDSYFGAFLMGSKVR